MNLLEGKVALITGAAQGIGRGIAEVFIEQGASVVIGDLDGDRSAEVADSLAAKGVTAIPVHIDVSEEDSVNSVVSNTIDSFRRLDILVNNAGIMEAYHVIDFPPESWRRVFQVNVEGMFLCSKAADKGMIDKGTGGSIINISSAAVRKADLKHAAYSSSKAAMVTFTRVLALELGPHGIRVNAILPGATVTPMLEHVFESIPGIREELISKTVLGKLAQPRDQANVAVFLASDLASHITGEYLVVSGGEFMNS